MHSTSIASRSLSLIAVAVSTCLPLILPLRVSPRSVIVSCQHSCFPLCNIAVVAAGMIALRSGKNKIGHEHYVDAIAEVQAKKKDVSDPPDMNNPHPLKPPKPKFPCSKLKVHIQTVNFYA